MSLPVDIFPLCTPRLVIRDYTAADIPAAQLNVGDPAYWAYHATEAASAERIAALISWAIEEQKISPRLNYYLAVTTAQNNHVIGEVVLRMTDQASHQAEIGFGVARTHWGQGYATEAARALLNAAFAHTPLHRIVAQCAPENIASVRVMEKIGMTREGVLRDVAWARGRWWSSAIYSILRPEQKS